MGRMVHGSCEEGVGQLRFFRCPTRRAMARWHELPANIRFLSRESRSRACAHYARLANGRWYCADRALLRERRSRDRNSQVSRTFMAIALLRGEERPAVYFGVFDSE